MAETAQLPDTDSTWLRFWWVAPLLLLAAAALGAWLLRRPASSRYEALPGYISSLATVEQEYVRFNGKLLQDAEVKQQFERAADLVKSHDYVGAITLLEGVSKKAAVPAVLNDLGVLYAFLDDRGRAINAFRDALARDIDYQPVRDNLKRLKDFAISSADPVTREVEPNNSNLLANLIVVGTSVDAEIAPDINDVDCLRFSVPAPPRDILAIEITNRSSTLVPVLTAYDGDQQLLDWGKKAEQRGESITQFISLKPNATVYLDVSGYANSGGRYSITVRPLKAFDSFEPNDDIMSARRITVGQPLEANIMDGDDTDYYSFVGPRTGTVSIDITNRSATLIPALSTFTQDLRSSGFGPDIRTAGASLHHTLPVEAGLTYYLQVWSQANSSGDYTLTVH